MGAMSWRAQEPEAVRAATAAAVGDAATGWSLGTFGALAEFHRGPGEAAEIAATANVWRAETKAGTLQVEGDGQRGKVG